MPLSTPKYLIYFESLNVLSTVEEQPQSHRNYTVLICVCASGGGVREACLDHVSTTVCTRVGVVLSAQLDLRTLV